MLQQSHPPPQEERAQSEAFPVVCRGGCASRLGPDDFLILTRAEVKMRLPIVLSRGNASRLLGAIDTPWSLMEMLLYGQA